jgi:cytochrome P450
MPISSVEFDPFSEVFFDDPYPTYRRLRDEAPVYMNDRYGFVALSRFADVVQAHRDWDTFSSAHGVDLGTLSSGNRLPEALSMIMMDPPEHHHMRTLVNRVFTPRAVADLEPMVRSVICSYLDELVGLTAFDAVTDISGPFPVEVICTLLGVPAGDRQQIRHQVDLLLYREPGDLNATEEGTKAALAFGSYLYDLVVDKRAHPSDDLLSALCTVEAVRDDGERSQLDDVEITAFAALLVAAGSETVTKLVASAVVLFARNRDEWRKVRGDPARIPGSVEEVLRYWPPSQYQGRFSVRDSELHGVKIPEGLPVILLTGAANHDEREFADPDRFDIGRVPGMALGFGHGIHTCLGAALARLESRIAIEEWSLRWPEFEVDESGLKRVHMANVAGYANVPVVVGRSAVPASEGSNGYDPAR